jgi:hypothetical protein
MLERGLDVDHTTLYRWFSITRLNGEASAVVLEADDGLQLAGR